MRQIVRFVKMKVVVPMKDGETVDEIEDRMIDAVESAGARFSTFKVEVEAEEDD